MEVNLIPKVSVILPVYNAAEFIEEAVESILLQTFQNFELIIINDCSTDNSLELLNRFSNPRIRLYSNPVNLKVVNTLNKGLALARGEYIARMDADDISHPKRFEKQVAYLDTNPDVDLCGSWVQTFGAEEAVMRAATEHEHIKVRMFFVNPVFHPAIMFRKESFEKYDLTYEEHYGNAEDYGLWVKVIDVLRFANIPEVLLKYRVHKNNVSVLKESNRQVLDEIHFNIFSYFLDKLDVPYTPDELLMHRKLGLVQVGKLELPELTKYLLWLKKLTLGNNRTNYFDSEHFRNVIISYLLYLLKQSSPHIEGLKLIYGYFGNLFNLRDYTGFFISRTKVKLQPIEKF